MTPTQTHSLLHSSFMQSTHRLSGGQLFHKPVDQDTRIQSYIFKNLMS